MRRATYAAFAWFTALDAERKLEAERQTTPAPPGAWEVPMLMPAPLPDALGNAPRAAVILNGEWELTSTGGVDVPPAGGRYGIGRICGSSSRRRPADSGPAPRTRRRRYLRVPGPAEGSSSPGRKGVQLMP